MSHELEATKDKTTAYRSRSMVLLPGHWPMLRVAKLLHCFAPRYVLWPFFNRGSLIVDMKLFHVIFLLAFSFTVGWSCSHSTSAMLSNVTTLGNRMPCESSDIVFLIAASQTAPGCHTNINGIQFLFATMDGRTINYLSTNDSQFQTPEGIHVGSTEREVGSVQGGKI